MLQLEEEEEERFLHGCIAMQMASRKWSSNLQPEYNGADRQRVK
jgi:hypothetical protein